MIERTSHLNILTDSLVYESVNKLSINRDNAVKDDFYSPSCHWLFIKILCNCIYPQPGIFFIRSSYRRLDLYLLHY